MNKPVAWIPKDHLKEMGKAGFRYTGVSYQGDKFYDIPLYTHPVKENCCPDCGCHFTGEYPFNYTVKELTDEEIDEISKEVWERPWLEVHRKFARAILRKAQEK